MRRTLAAIALTLGLLATPAIASARSLTFGMHTPSDPLGGNTSQIDRLERDLGRRIGIVSWFQNWGGGPWVSSVQPRVFASALRKHRRPLVTWEPWVPGGGVNQPDFSLSRIAGGAFDSYITSWARALRELRRTIYIRPMHEMNGDWYPWGGTVNGNSPELFRAAWRRMHDIFSREGANNVRWVFSPINEDWPIRLGNRMEDYYPGPGYVDVLALDGYNWGSSFPGFGGWRGFRRTFSKAYRRLSRLGSQPIWIAEVGSSGEGGSKAAWVRDMFRSARKMRRLRGIVWMDTITPHEGDWRARTPAGTAAAFRAGRGGGRSRPRLHAARTARVGRAATVRWGTMGSGDDVQSWRVYLSGRLVHTVPGGRRRIARKRIRHVGRYRWTVRGVDAQGHKVASASRSFRVRRR